MGKMRSAYKILENLKRRDCLRYVSVGGRLRLILK
jgi:hypothetical protein